MANELMSVMSKPELFGTSNESWTGTVSPGWMVAGTVNVNDDGPGCAPVNGLAHEVVPATVSADAAVASSTGLARAMAAVAAVAASSRIRMS